MTAPILLSNTSIQILHHRY